MDVGESCQTDLQTHFDSDHDVDEKVNTPGKIQMADETEHNSDDSTTGQATVVNKENTSVLCNTK